MEMNKSAVAAEISFNDRKKLIELMEDLFEGLGKRGLVKSQNPRLVGKIFAYAQLAIIADNSYYRYFKKLGIDEIYRRQGEELSLVLKELIGG
jgi:hypothetical protein